MRRIRIALIALVALVFAAGSASAWPLGLRLGVKAGLNFNNLQYAKDLKDAGFGSDTKCGYTAGVMVEYKLPLVGIGADLSVLYTRMNAETTFNPVPGVSMTHSHLGKNFIEIPLNLKYYLTLPAISAIFKPGIYTGPTLALCCDCGENNSWKSKTCQWGWNLGLTFEFIKRLQISGGYTWGLNNVLDTSGIPVVGSLLGSMNNVEMRNDYWSVTAAWLF